MTFLAMLLRPRCLASLALLLATTWASAAAPEPIPIDVFFKKATLRMPKLSPSGRWLAVLSSIPDHHVGVMMIDLESREKPNFIEASVRDDVDWIEWVNEDWLVFSVDNPDYRGNSYQGNGLMSMKRDGQKSRMLIHREFLFRDPSNGKALEPTHHYLGRGAPGSDEVVVGKYEYDVNYELSHVVPMALNVATGAVRSLLKDAPQATGWFMDANGQPRVAVSESKTEVTIHWADKPGGPWREISRAPVFKQSFAPAYVEGDDRLMVSTSNGAGDLELRSFDFGTGKPSAAALLATPGFSGALAPDVDRSSGVVLGVELSLAEDTTVWFGPAMQRVQKEVDAKLPGRVNKLACRPCDNPRTVLVSSYSDVNPGEYFVYRPEKDEWLRLGTRRPDIVAARMAPMGLYRTPARDGEEVPVWVTRPANETGKPQAAVVLVHGGPWLRGSRWEWEAEAQFLASRGYVVVEPEFRGSTGYGEGHFRAGFKQWGLTMQDDVTDALKFAVDKGWVDPARVCIMGGSYGGYATLMGLVKDPDQYRCGVAFAAVSDPRFMFTMHWSDISTESRQYTLPQLIGDPVKDEAQLIATSPVEQAARIKAPLLLVHGGVDRRVPIQNGERMRDAMLKNHKQVEWLYYPDEGHGFTHPENEIDYYRHVEAFLAKYLH